MSILFSKAQRVIPDDMKEGYSVCVEYVEKYTPEKVKTCVNATLNKLSSVLDGLDKGAEITSAGVRRLLRDDLGVAQATAQDVSDVIRAGTQIAISLMPSKAVSIARSLPKVEIVRLAPSGTRGSTYRFTFKDGSSSLRTINPRIINTPQMQKAFVERMIDKKTWKTQGRIGGRTAYYDEKKKLYYTEDRRHYDIEVWQVRGKWGYHKGSIECEHGLMYKEPTHPREPFL